MVLMKGRYIFLMLVLLLSVCSTLPSVFAGALANLTWTTPDTLLTTYQPNPRIKAWNVDGYWYLFSIKEGASQYQTVSKFLSTWGLQSSSTQICVDASGCRWADCNYISSSKGKLVECWTVENDGSYGSAILRYNISNNAWSVLDSQPYSILHPHPSEVSAVANDFIDVDSGYTLKWWKNNGATQPVFAKGDSIGNQAGNGEWTLPVAYNDPTDLQVAWCGGYYHFIELRTSGNQFVDVIYDDKLIGITNNDENYTGQAYSLKNPEFYIQTNEYGVWVDRTNPSTDYLNVVVMNNSGDYPLIQFQRMSCNSDGTLSWTDNYLINQTEIEPTANYTANKYMRYPFLVRDEDDFWHLFYAWYDGVWTIKQTTQEETCIEGAWHNTTICDGTLEKFTRNCYPSGCCENTTKWEETAYCIAQEGGDVCDPEWFCYDQDTRAYRELNCDISSLTDCTGGTPYCYGGNCVSECQSGYYCVDTETRAFSTSSCQVSEILNCNSTGDGYCTGGRCQTIQTPAFNESDSTLDIIEQMTGGVKNMLSWMAKPTFVILLAMAVTILIIGIFSLLASIGDRATRRGR